MLLKSFSLFAVIALFVVATNSATAMSMPSGGFARLAQPSVDLAVVRPIVITSPRNTGHLLRARDRPEQMDDDEEQSRLQTVKPSQWARIEEAVLNDPRFQNCMSETEGPNDPNFMSVFANCYSLAGRPRFGKRSWQDLMARFDEARKFKRSNNF